MGGLLGGFGKSISKGWDAGAQSGLGPIGGLLGAIGGGIQGLGANQNAQAGQIPLGLLGQSAQGQMQFPPMRAPDGNGQQILEMLLKQKGKF